MEEMKGHEAYQDSGREESTEYTAQYVRTRAHTQQSRCSGEEYG